MCVCVWGGGGGGGERERGFNSFFSDGGVKFHSPSSSGIMVLPM